MSHIQLKNMTYQAFLGFHQGEQDARQKVCLDLRAHLQSSDAALSDNPEQIEFNYFQANLSLMNFFETTRVNLVESLGQQIADLMMSEFPKLKGIEVTVKKYPKDLSNVQEVSYSTKVMRA